MVIVGVFLLLFNVYLFVYNMPLSLKEKGNFDQIKVKVKEFDLFKGLAHIPSSF